MSDRVPYRTPFQAGKNIYWCSCGKSKKQPYCDGSHRGTEFQPLAFEPSNDMTVALCGCKLTKQPPYCDGSHIALHDKDKTAAE